MWNKRKQLVALTAVAGLLGLTAIDTIAQTPSPFGKGNPFDNLANAITRLNDQIQGILSPPTPTNLIGDYAQVTSTQCMVSPAGFNVNLALNPPTPNQSLPFLMHINAMGTMRFNGDGTVVDTANGMVLRDITTPNSTPTGTFTVTCDSRYVVNSDGTFTQTRTRCDSTDNADGTTSVISGDVQFQGRIVNGGKVLYIANITPNLETIVNSRGATNYRICTRNFILTKIN